MSLRGFYINLDRSAERRQHVEAELRKLAPLASYQRFPAVDGRGVTGRPDVKNRAELGCYLSHLGVVRQNAGFDGWLHVIEDDIVISRHTPQAIAMLISKPAFDKYDILFHSITINGNLFATQALRTAFDNNVVAAASGGVTAIKTLTTHLLGKYEFFGCVSYLINPRAIARTADLLARHLEAEPFEPVDVVFSKLAQSGALSMACIVPFFVVPRLSRDSTIQDGLHLWRFSQIFIKHALYADRDVPELRRVLSELERNSAASPTSELIADVQRIMIKGDLNSNIVLP